MSNIYTRTVNVITSRGLNSTLLITYLLQIVIHEYDSFQVRTNLGVDDINLWTNEMYDYVEGTFKPKMMETISKENAFS